MVKKAAVNLSRAAWSNIHPGMILRWRDDAAVKNRLEKYRLVRRLYTGVAISLAAWKPQGDATASDCGAFLLPALCLAGPKKKITL
jgi:hypothetical protein